MKRFEVWMAALDPAEGAEIKKTRPVVIVSPDIINELLGTVIVAPMTSSVYNYPTRIQTDFDKKGGEIVLDQLRTIDKSRLKRKMGEINEQEATAICDILKIMFEY